MKHLVAVEGIKQGDTIGTADHDLPIQGERPRLQLGGGNSRGE
jgi:hypothetical protein